MTDRHARGALVTGGAQRIGRAIALALAEDGWHVAIHYNSSDDEALALAEEITARGGRAEIVQADLLREDEVATLMERAVRQLGPISCLVNNASTFVHDDVASATRATWDLHMEVNLRAPFLLSQGFARALPAETSGVIVNLIDQRVWNLTPHFMTYTLSKAGLWALTQTLALALAPRIRVNGIGPGPTLPSVHQTDAEFRRQCEQMPLGRGTSPDEIAAAVRFILAAPALTGQMLALDGGQHLGWAHRGGNPRD